MRTHLGPLLDQFELVLECGLLPESYITQVDALFENIKLLLPRLDMNRRSKAKKRMERIAAQLHLFKDDCFSPVWDLCQTKLLNSRLSGTCAKAKQLTSRTCRRACWSWGTNTTVLDLFLFLLLLPTL